jgi:RNA polymerase sigma-70 factor (ECF subfamily)
MTTDNSPSHAAHTFQVTKWSMVRLAVAEKQMGADQALDQLCRCYEKPILAYIIRHGHSPQEAEDLKQSFFLDLIQDNALADAEATRVKLRAFLLTRLKTFLVDAFRYDNAQKRGAGKVVAIGDLSEAQQHLAEPVDHITPDLAYQRQWLATVFSTAMHQLRADYAARYQGSLFEALGPYIDPRSQPSISTLAATLSKPEGTIKSDLSRLRARWREFIRDHIAATLNEPSTEAIDTELKELMGYR